MDSTDLDVAVVMSTFNRLPLLKKAISSIRWAVGGLSYVIVVVDGGSSDGSREWLIDQPDAQTIWQELPLTGAVKAYNMGFAHAVGTEAPYICLLNDDDECQGPGCIIEAAVSILDADKTLGGIAFEADLRGQWMTEDWQGKPSCGKGVMRREALMAVARAQGDPAGCKFWDEQWKTYAADSAAGCWAHKLGYPIKRGVGLRVHDNARDGGDDLRKRNVADYVKGGTASLFTNKWGAPNSQAYDMEMALKYGGRVEVPHKASVAKPIQRYGGNQ